MNNPQIDFTEVFGAVAPHLPSKAEGAIPCVPPSCPPIQEMTVVQEPLCTCTAEDHAYREGAEVMRKAILEAIEYNWDSDMCSCASCVREIVQGVVW